MTKTEMKQRLSLVLSTLDDLSKSEGLRVCGIGAIQQVAGCVGIINDILSAQEIADDVTPAQNNK